MPQRPSKGAITFQRFLQKVKKHLSFDTSCLEERLFYVYRTDTHQVLARGIDGYDAAKQRANQIRHQHGLKWDQVKFKSERSVSSSASGPQGHSGKIDYASRVNPSKGRRFRGYYDQHGNFHDID